MENPKNRCALAVVSRANSSRERRNRVVAVEEEELSEVDVVVGVFVGGGVLVK